MVTKSVTPQRRKSRVSLIVVLLLVAVLLFAWLERLAIYDWLRLYNYQPAAAVTQLATDTTMTDEATHMYYVNHPELKNKATFSDYCNSATEQTVVLGCYKAGQRGIYLLQVDNAELAGITQVTAAHEMLHAAYDRLSESERSRVNGMLKSYYQNQLQNQAIKDTIDEYKQSEPNDVVNEMHSIFGTQVANLPPELEVYYKQYFTNRSMVIEYYNAYEQAFSGRQKQIKQYDNQLEAWKKQINELEDSLASQESSLNARRKTLNEQHARGDYEAYNAGVDNYNNAVNTYNQDLTRLKQLIADYNAMIAKRNAIAFEEQQLMESLNSSKFQQQ